MSVVQIHSPADKSRLCEQVLADLSDWFGFDEVAAYVRDIASLLTIAAGVPHASLGGGLRHGRAP